MGAFFYAKKLLYLRKSFSMTITTISDTHNKHNLIPKEFLSGGDVIIHAGDMSSRGMEYEIDSFLNWYETLPYTHKILIAGNHDFFFENASKYIIEDKLKKYPNITYLNDSGVDIEGIKIWGSPVQPYFHDWAFNRKGEDIKKHWDLIPSDIDILIVHGGPKGKGDLNLTLRGEDVGCPYLTETIDNRLNNLKCFIHGHIHEGYGTYEDENGVLYINTSVLDVRYVIKNKPQMFYMDTNNKKINKNFYEKR